jgi:hypothetical protein
MRSLPLILPVLALPVLLLILALRMKDTDSPHGKDFKVRCSVCHSPEGWKIDPKVYSFDHNKTEMPLTGQHTSVDCRMCHPTLVFPDAETECYSCHTDMHKQTVGFECARCHTTGSWLVPNITDIHRESRFPLQGAHLAAECMQCHPSASQLSFVPLGIDCYDCHQADYMAAREPNHVDGKLSTDCLECHSMSAFSWSGSGFTHAFFPLTGGHDIKECGRCHVGGTFQVAASECVSCHLRDYQATSNPAHQAAGISTECAECHTTMPGWKPASFAQHDAIFPLTGGHAITDCNLCHTGGNYTNISSECVSCHQADFNATSNPDHGAAGFPTDCMLCHTTVPGWKPADFRVHDAQFFPVYSGSHRNAWQSCTDCHANTSNYAVFSCIDCHEHSKARMDDTHLGEVSGYQYNSISCLDCHPTGRAED